MNLEPFLEERIKRNIERAERLVTGRGMDSDSVTEDDLIAIYKWRLSKILGIGLFDAYFQSRTLDELVFELYLHVASDPEYQRQLSMQAFKDAVETKGAMFGGGSSEWEPIEVNTGLSDEEALQKAQQEFNERS